MLAPKLAGGDDPLTVYSGPAPLDLALLSLHESGGYLFARYALRHRGLSDRSSSISTRQRGSSSPATTTIVAAGRTASK